jgi:Asp-tRNA(Asn)/Glu-tRNA(Gln) amidotransferase A subunit family amidase
VNATETAAAVRAGTTSARAVVDATLARIAVENPDLNAFTSVLPRRAVERAEAIDAAIAAGTDPGPLAGVPFAAKNLFDVAGIVTRAGAKVTAGDPPAVSDADAIVALERRGAILVGLTNMDEFAYGFVTENAHDGPTHNPHDLTRIAGGSSGGSASAVGGGLVPLALASDTNGSIRVPAALCGIFGIRPTFGTRLAARGISVRRQSRYGRPADAHRRRPQRRIRRAGSALRTAGWFAQLALRATGRLLR